jgi:hypothetical protein
VEKFSRTPDFVSVNLRATYRLPLGSRAKADLIAEFFNLLNRDNYDVNSLTVNGAEYLSGPTLANPSLPLVANPNYKKYTSTLPPLEAQVGVRLTF